MDMSALTPNPGKDLVIKTSFGDFARYPVKTKLVESGDSIPAILDDSALPYVQKGDIGMPETMELALRDVGKAKILFAAFCSAVTKPFGIRGVFYKIAGTGARAIDGPCDCTIPPYNHCAKLAPKDPDKVARELKKHTGCDVVIMDANDIGREILGRSDDTISIEMCKEIFADNPLGQGSQQTPVCIIRKV